MRNTMCKKESYEVNVFSKKQSQWMNKTCTVHCYKSCLIIFDAI